MVMRVEKLGETLCVVIPAEAAEALNLREGTAVEVKAANSGGAVKVHLGRGSHGVLPSN